VRFDSVFSFIVIVGRVIGRDQENIFQDVR